MRSAFLTIAGVFLFVLVGATTALPCKCVPSSLRSYYRRADAVVTGTVTFISSDERTVTATMGIIDRWKQDLPGQIEVVTENSSCAYDLKVDTKHLLYLKKLPSGKYSTMECQGNLSFDRSRKARNWLRLYGKKGKVELNSILLPNIFDIGASGILWFGYDADIFETD